jgi:flavorubredoxin
LLNSGESFSPVGLNNLEPTPNKVIVLYDTLFGNTERVAKALAKGIQRHCEVDCLNIKNADTDNIAQCNLVAVGAPTQAFSASKPMKEFLAKLEKMNLAGRYGFAFDTNLDSRFSGSAAKYIEKRLQDIGIEIMWPRASAIVNGGTKDAVLRDGEIEIFETLGDEIGTDIEKKRLPSIAKVASITE